MCQNALFCHAQFIRVELFVYCKETEIYRMLSHSRVKFLRSLQTKKHRDQEKAFLVEGEKLVNEILLPDNNSNYYATEVFGLESWEEANQDWIRSKTVTFTRINSKQLNQISSQTSPNKVIALVKQNTTNITASPGYDGLILAFDKLQDPGNLGTIIRLADWFGVSRIVLSKDSVDHLNSKVIQASMGSFFRIPVIKCELLNWLKSKPKDLKVFGAILDAPSLYTTELNKDGVILLGNESSGIREEIMPLLTQAISIPKYSIYPPGPESLNVGTATGIILSEFKRRLA